MYVCMYACMISVIMHTAVRDVPRAQQDQMTYVLGGLTLCVYLCMYVCVCGCVCVHMHTQKHTYVGVQTYRIVNIHIYLAVHACHMMTKCMYVGAYMYIYVYIYIYIYMYACMYVYTHTSIHIYLPCCACLTHDD